jgi:hypothetical protein
VVCLAPRDPEEIVGPRRLSGVVVRPLNFTVRVRNKTELAMKAARVKSKGKDPSLGVSRRARAAGRFGASSNNRWSGPGGAGGWAPSAPGNCAPALPLRLLRPAAQLHR